MRNSCRPWLAAARLHSCHNSLSSFSCEYVLWKISSSRWDDGYGKAGGERKSRKLSLTYKHEIIYIQNYFFCRSSRFLTFSAFSSTLYTRASIHVLLSHIVSDVWARFMCEVFALMFNFLTPNKNLLTTFSHSRHHHRVCAADNQEKWASVLKIENKFEWVSMAGGSGDGST